MDNAPSLLSNLRASVDCNSPRWMRPMVRLRSAAGPSTAPSENAGNRVTAGDSRDPCSLKRALPVLSVLKILRSASYERVTASPLCTACQVPGTPCPTRAEMESREEKSPLPNAAIIWLTSQAVVRTPPKNSQTGPGHPSPWLEV